MVSSVDVSPRQPLLVTLAARLSIEMASMNLEQLLSLEATLLSSLAQVRGSINMTVSPANRLPVEILERIFEHVPKLVPFHQYNTRWGHGVRDFRTLLKVTHVCRRWRDIALSMQALWGHISNGDRDPRVWQDILERSGDKALHVSLKHSIDQSLAAIFQSSPSRLVELHLHFFRGWILASSLNFSVPNLRKLTIEKACFSPYVQNRSGAPTIFQGIAPTLRFMELRETDVFPNLRLPNLTHLSLDHCSRTSGSQTLLSLLSRAPNLVHLVIFDSELYNDPRPTPEALTQSVSLSKLRRLDIYTDGKSYSHSFKVLPRLTFDAVNEVCIRYDAKWHHPHLQIVSGLPVTASITRVSVDVKALRWLSRQRFRVLGAGPTGSICLEQHAVDQDTWAEDLSELFCPAQIQEIWLSKRWRQLPEHTLVALLRCAPDLKKLVLNVDHVDELLEVLMLSDRRLEMICPNLETLHILSFDLTRGMIEKDKVLLQKIAGVVQHLHNSELTIVFYINGDQAHQQDAFGMLEDFRFSVQYHILTRALPKMSMPPSWRPPRFHRDWSVCEFESDEDSEY